MVSVTEWISNLLGEPSPRIKFHQRENTAKADTISAEFSAQIDQRFNSLAEAVQETGFKGILPSVKEYIELYRDYVVRKMMQARQSSKDSPYVFDLVASGSGAYLEALAVKTIFPDAIIRASDIDTVRTRNAQDGWDGTADSIKNSSFMQTYPGFMSNVTFITADARNLLPQSPKKADAVSLLNIGPVGSRLDLPNLLFESAERLTKRGSVLIATALTKSEIPYIGESLTRSKAFAVQNHGTVPADHSESVYLWVSKRVDYPKVVRPITRRGK